MSKRKRFSKVEKYILLLVFILTLLQIVALFSSHKSFFYAEVVPPLFNFILCSLNFALDGLCLFILFSLTFVNPWVMRFSLYLNFFNVSASLLFYICYGLVFDLSTLMVGFANMDKRDNFITVKTFLIGSMFAFLLPALLDIFLLRKKLKKEDYSFTKKRFHNILTASVITILLFISYIQVRDIAYPKSNSGMSPQQYNAFMNTSFKLTLYPNSIFYGFTALAPWNSKEIDKYIKETELKNYSLKESMKDKAQTIVFIFGESLDASHLSANGYKRNTTPYLNKEENIVFLKKTKSCATNTGTAHPCITKPFNTQDYLQATNIYPLITNPKIHSFIDIFKSQGFETSYVGGEHAETSLKLLFKNFDHKVKIDERDGAENYVQAFKKLLSDGASKNKRLIVVSTWGEHAPYEQEKGFAKFPVKKGLGIISKLKNEEDKKYLYNRYDNVIFYTDMIISRMIKALKKSQKNTLVYFFSDHGENLDEKGFGIHGSYYPEAPYDVTHPGAFLWVSDNWLKNINPKTLDLFKRYKDKEFSYDRIFHSVLDCSGFESKYINKSQSLCYK